MNSVILTIMISTFTPTSNTILSTQYLPMPDMMTCLETIEKSKQTTSDNISIAYMCERND